MRENKIELCFGCEKPCILRLKYGEKSLKVESTLLCVRESRCEDHVRTFTLGKLPAARPGRRPKYPLAELAVGEIREITPDPGDTPATCRRKVTMAAAHFREKHPDRQFACRNVNGKIVCMRIA